MPAKSSGTHDIQLVNPHPESKIDHADVDKFTRGIYRIIGHFENLSDSYRFIAGEMAEQAAQLRMLRLKLYTIGRAPHETSINR
jgi:hypothetical protein